MQWKTAITNIENEKEYIRGYDLQELIAKKSFVEAIYLIWKGELPNEHEIRMMNALFTAGIDHGPGTASAQNARITASTKNPMQACLAAGILGMGEQHGSAIEGAARFFQENNETEDLPGLLKSLKEKKIRIAGYGHAFLEHDHRTDALFAVAKETKLFGECCEFALELEKELNAQSSKKLPLNIDGAMGAIVSDMGFDWKIAKGFFIVARLPGLVAHVYEEMMSGDGIRRVEQDEIEYIGVPKREIC